MKNYKFFFKKPDALPTEIMAENKNETNNNMNN